MGARRKVWKWSEDFARYLHATRRVRKTSFSVDTKGGRVHIKLHVNNEGVANSATVEMGEATFDPKATIL